MQLVGSPHSGCNFLGRQLNPQESKFYTETIFNHLCTSQNFINCLMTTDSLGRMDFLAHKISEKIKVNIQHKILIPKNVPFSPFLCPWVNLPSIIFFRMRTKDLGSAKDSLLIFLPYNLTINSSIWQKNQINPKIGSYILPDTFSNLMHKKLENRI